MGTKVHRNSYLPGYYAMRDLNEEAPSAWPLHFEDRGLNGQFCNVFTSRPINGYAEYDRELLKQTMLRHEEIFRKQVVELHRLYRIQRDMMVDLQRKREKRNSVQGQSSNPRPFYGVDDARTHLSLLHRSTFQFSPMSRENEDSLEVHQLLDFKPRKFPRRMLDLKLPADAYMESDDAECAEEKDVFKPLFGSADLSTRTCGRLPENDVNLTLGVSQNASNEIEKSSSHQSNDLCQKLADLNEPLNEVSCEEVTVSSSRFPVKVTNCGGLRGHQISMESVSSFSGLQKDLFDDRYRGGAESVFLCIDTGENWQKRPFCNNEIGQSSNHAGSFTSSLCKKDVQPSSEPVLVKPKKAHDFSTIFSPKQRKMESLFREKPSQQSQINELSDISSYNLHTKYSELTIPTTPSPLATLPCTDYAKTSSLLVSSSWRQSSSSISPISVEVQALSGIGGSTPMNVQSRSSGTSLQNCNAWEKWQCTNDFRSTSSFGLQACLYPNGSHHGSLTESSASSRMILPPINFDNPNFNNRANFPYEKSECHRSQESFKGLHDVKNVKGMNLNVEPPNGFWNGSVPQQKVHGDVDGQDSLSGRISWLRTKSPCSEPIDINKGIPNMEFGVMKGHFQMMSNYCTSTPKVDLEKDAEDSLVDVLQDLPTNLKAKEIRTQQNESPVSSSCKKILGFPVPQCGKISFAPILRQEISQSDIVNKKVKEEFLQANLLDHSKLLNSEKQIQVELILEKGAAKCVGIFRDGINLNSSATNVDQPNLPTCSSKDETELLSPVSVQGTATRFVSEIDLEAPITSLSEEEMQLAESASHCNQVFSVVEPDNKREGLWAKDVGDETLVKMAAETIQMISLDKPLCSEDITLCTSPPVSADILHWFADVVTYNGPENVLGTSKGDGNDGWESSDIDGMDYFEYMTLQLKETKIDEHCCRHLGREDPMEEETGTTHLPLTRSSRGQARRRRQRRDFQKDILPGLASLSRYEVSEDLQVIGGLMRASGQLWQPGGVRRNTSRTRSRCQVKGRRPRGSAAGTVTGIQLDPQPRQPSNTDIEIDARIFLGWGRTTRRCQRHKSSSSNILVPLQS